MLALSRISGVKQKMRHCSETPAQVPAGRQTGETVEGKRLFNDAFQSRLGTLY